MLRNDTVRLSLPLLVSFGLPILLATLRGRDLSVGTSILASWDAYVFCYLCLTWALIARSTAEQTRLWALQEQRRSRLARLLTGRAVGTGFVVSVSVTGLGAGIFLLPQLRGRVATLWEIALSALTVILAWFLLHTSYALYYAYQYYRAEGGLQFPGGQEPDLLDCAYVAFAIGTTFAVSDVEIADRRIRRIALGHGLLSFGYNTALLALVINLLFGGV